MAVGRLALAKDTLASDWTKNPIVGPVAKAIKGAATPPAKPLNNQYGQIVAVDQLSRPAGAVAQPVLDGQPDGQQASPQQVLARTSRGVPPVGVQFGPEVKPLSQELPNVTASIDRPDLMGKKLPDGMSVALDGNQNRRYTMGESSMTVNANRPGVLPGGNQQADPRKVLASSPGRAEDGRDYVAEATAAGIDVGKLVQEQTDRFNAPTGVNAQSMAAMQDQFARMNPVRERLAQAPQAQAMEAPKYLGKESGLGWKTRAKLYGDQVDMFNKATGNQTAMNVEQMREAGAGNRAILAARGQNDANDIARQQVNQKTDQFGIEQQRLGLNDAATRDYQGSQAQHARAQAEDAGLTKFKVQTGEKDQFGAPLVSEVGYDRNSKSVIDPSKMMRENGAGAAGMGGALFRVPKDPKTMKPGQEYVFPGGRIGTWDEKKGVKFID